MTTKPAHPFQPVDPTASMSTRNATDAALSAFLTQAPPAHTFAMRFTSTPRGARLARRLTAVRLDAWGIPYGTDPHEAIVLITAELAANAVRHGHVPGRDFHLRLHDLPTAPGGRTVRVEVTDTRAERPPRRRATPCDPADAEETGRGLLLVAHLAARWDWHPRSNGPGKTVWAEYTFPPGSPS
ncbi:ATP-binding protein [Streptomyces mexicanus]|nr:ATP-binding protein [Streptomyces mexicanus]